MWALNNFWTSYQFTSPCLALNISYPSIHHETQLSFVKWNVNQQIKRPPQKLLFPMCGYSVMFEKVFHLDCCKIVPEDKLSKKCNIPPDWCFECQSPLHYHLILIPSTTHSPNIIQWKATNTEKKRIKSIGTKYLRKTVGLPIQSNKLNGCMFDLMCLLYSLVSGSWRIW